MRRGLSHLPKVQGPRHFQYFPTGPLQADHWDGRTGHDPQCTVSGSVPHPLGYLHHPHLCATAEYVDRLNGGDCGTGFQGEQEDLEASGELKETVLGNVNKILSTI